MWPKSLLPWIKFNGWWMDRALNYAISEAPQSLGRLAREALWLIGKAQDFIQWFVRMRTAAWARDHVEVLATAILTPGGWLMLGQFSGLIVLAVFLIRLMRERRKNKIKVPQV